jgi:hypothetical protein
VSATPGIAIHTLTDGGLFIDGVRLLYPKAPLPTDR